MASTKPIVRQIAWVSLVPQLFFIALLSIIFSLFIDSVSSSLICGALCYIILYFVLRTIVPCYHRKGMSLIKKDMYKEAIMQFERSYNFFVKYAWIDKYRYIVLLSSSRISYTEMALANIAFSYSQIGDGEKSKQYYEKIIDRFPDSQFAKTALNFIAAFQTKH